MKRVLRILLPITVCAVVVAWLGRVQLTEWLRIRLEGIVTQAVGSPSRIEALQISFVPLRVHVHGVTIGSNPLLARIDDAEVQVVALESLSEGRPVVTVNVESPHIDLTHLPKSPAAPPAAAARHAPHLPPLHVKTATVHGVELRFLMVDTPATLTVGELAVQAKTGLLRRSATATIALSAAELQRKTYRLRLADVHADGGFDAGGLYLSTATVTGEGINATAASTLVPHRFTVSATFDPGLLGVVVDELALIGGSVEVEGTVNGDLANPTSGGRLVLHDGAIAHHVLGDLTAHVTHHGAKLGFDDVVLVGPAGQVTGAVDLVLLKETPINAEVQIAAADLERVLGVIGQPVPFETVLTGAASLHGSLDPTDLAIRGAGTMHDASKQATEVGTWEGSAQVRPHALQATADIVQPQGNRVSARVDIAGGDFGGGVTVTAPELAALHAILPRPVRVLALTGQGEGAASFGGTIAHPTIAGTIALRGISVSGVPVARVGGGFSIAAERLALNDVMLETASGHATASGGLALDAGASNDWQLMLQELDATLPLALAGAVGGLQLPLSGGTMSGRVVCRGPWEHLSLQADLSTRSPQIFGEPLERVDLQTTVDLPQWTVHAVAARAAHETLTIDGKGAGATQLRLSVETTPIDLANIRAAGRRWLGGRVTLHGEVAGGPTELDGSVAVAGSALSIAGHALGDVSLRATGNRGLWMLAGSGFDGTVSLDASVRTTAALPYTLAVRWQDTRLSSFVGVDEALQVTSTGHLDLSGSLRDPMTPSGNLRVTVLDVARDQYRVSAREPIWIEVEGGRLRIRSLALAAHGSELAVSGELSTAGDIDLRADGSGDLMLLEVVGPPFSAARGAFSVSAHVRHQPAAGWELGGQVSVRDATVDFGGPVALTKTNAELTLAGNAIRIERCSGRAGGGDFQVGGTLDLLAGPSLSWDVHELSLSLLEGLDARVTGHGAVRGTWRVVTVDGSIEVLNALYDRNVELTDLVPWFREHIQAPARTQPPPTEVRLDLRIYARGGVFIDNNVAKAEMWLNLQVAGTTDQPGVTGTVGILGGEVTFRDRTFTVTGGSIDFRDRFHINPVLNLTADSRITTTDSEYTVTVAVSGTADNPRVQFSADDPSLTQNDVLSLVTFGKTQAQLQHEGGGVSAYDALALLPTRGVEKRVSQLVGVDRFEIETTQSRNTGAIEPRVTIGKDLTDQIRALASTSFGVEARQSVQLEYRVTRRISLLGSWEAQTAQQAGAFGGDIKFRYEFRTLPFTLRGGDLGDLAPVDGR